jgi:2-dehydropantoate 2-reductase
VGNIVAAFLAKGRYKVTLCDVFPELVKPALEPGILIEGTEKFQVTVSRIVTSVDDLADDPPDVIFLTVKANAVPLIASAIESFHRDGLYVVSWQNGIDTELVLAQTMGKRAVMRAVVNYGCLLVKPGHVDMKFHHVPHYIQELDQESRPAAIAVADALTKSGLVTDHTDQIDSMVWRKTIMNACMNALLKEGVNVARANEISLGSDFYPYSMAYMKDAGDHKPSMLIDIEKKRRTEVDYINGKIIDYGERAGLETPYNKTMRALVKALEPK